MKKLGVNYLTDADAISKEFFDTLDEFVPIVFNGSNPTCGYLPNIRTIQFPLNHKEVVERFKNIEGYKHRIIYHEFAHAIDDTAQKGEWFKSKKWNDLYKEIAKEINKQHETYYKA